MIVSVISQKGGAGKTTLALNLAGAWAAAGARVLLIDADPQGTARDWAGVRRTPAPFSVRYIPRPVVHQAVKEFIAGGAFDHVLIDGPPRNYDLARSVILAGDMVVIPVQPSGADFWASRETVTLLREAAVLRSQRSAFVISRRIGRSSLGHEILAPLAADFQLPILKSGTNQRVAHAEAMTVGSTVIEAAPRGPAAREVREILAEIEEISA